MSKSSLHILMSLTSDFIKVQSQLRDIIAESVNYENPQRYIAFRAGNVKGSWFAKNYLSVRREAGMKNALSKIAKCEAGKQASSLEINIIRRVSQEKGITNSKNFERLEFLLPTVLLNLAKVETDYHQSLVFLSARLSTEIAKTEAMLSSVKEKAKEEKEEKKEINLLGQQNVAVETIINDILSSIDKKLAHHIRQLISKSDDKLAILKEELTKAHLAKA